MLRRGLGLGSRNLGNWSLRSRSLRSRSLRCGRLRRRGPGREKVLRLRRGRNLGVRRGLLLSMGGARGGELILSVSLRLHRGGSLHRRLSPGGRLGLRRILGLRGHGRGLGGNLGLRRQLRLRRCFRLRSNLVPRPDRGVTGSLDPRIGGLR